MSPALGRSKAKILPPLPDRSKARVLSPVLDRSKAQALSPTLGRSKEAWTLSPVLGRSQQINNHITHAPLGLWTAASILFSVSLLLGWNLIFYSTPEGVTFTNPPWQRASGRENQVCEGGTAVPAELAELLIRISYLSSHFPASENHPGECCKSQCVIDRVLSSSLSTTRTSIKMQAAPSPLQSAMDMCHECHVSLCHYTSLRLGVAYYCSIIQSDLTDGEILLREGYMWIKA
uniref:uncharacterized protein LOC118555895 n=1 Tax=Halichoerus grypus TaxID=9711 RepID=UPI0016593703|nr:uncharacterized protein LOC118555895 [Halichoerus grypus]